MPRLAWFWLLYSSWISKMFFLAATHCSINPVLALQFLRLTEIQIPTIILWPKWKTLYCAACRILPQLLCNFICIRETLVIMSHAFRLLRDLRGVLIYNNQTSIAFHDIKKIGHGWMKLLPIGEVCRLFMPAARLAKVLICTEASGLPHISPAYMLYWSGTNSPRMLTPFFTLSLKSK